MPGPIPPDGDDLATINPGVPMAGLFDGTLDYLAPGTGPFGLSGDMGGTGGGTLFFDIPNVPDFHPVKHLQIQINGVWDMSPPPIVTLLDGFIGLGVFPGVFVASDETFPGFHRVEDWDIFPNPDFETLMLFIPEGSFVNQVVIDTISAIPIPAAVRLFGSALGMLGWMRRKPA